MLAASVMLVALAISAMLVVKVTLATLAVQAMHLEQTDILDHLDTPVVLDIPVV
jgi:hypothetical protein